MELNIEKIEQTIIDDTVDRLVGERDLQELVKLSVAAKINAHFVEVADAQIRKAIEQAVRDGFEREYQRVDAFGHPQGEKTSIKQRLIHIVSDYWSQRVDKQGNPSTSDYSTISRAEYTMTKVCAADFSERMKAEVVTVTAMLKDGLRANLRKATDQMLGELFHVRSLDDQKEGRHV